jgi:hypothetical protein
MLTTNVVLYQESLKILLPVFRGDLNNANDSQGSKGLSRCDGQIVLIIRLTPLLQFIFNCISASQCPPPHVSMHIAPSENLSLTSSEKLIVNALLGG